LEQVLEPDSPTSQAVA